MSGRISLGKIGCRNMMYGDEKLSAKSYVQYGLVAMWDGIENAGWGIHTSERILTNLVTGDVVQVPTSGYEMGISYVISDPSHDFVLGTVDAMSVPCTLTSVGCCMTKPTNYANASGIISLVGIGGLYMWRRYPYGACGVVGGSIFHSNKQVFYYGAPSGISEANAEADAETFGVLRSRAAVIRSQDSSEGLIYYYDGVAKNGTNVMENYTDSWSVATYNVTSPVAESCKIKWCNVAVYSRALTAAEIAHNSAVDKARFNLPDAT